MAGDNNRDTDYKTSQETRATSILLQTDTGSRIKEHPNPSGMQCKLRSINRIPKGNRTRLWLRILGHHRNQKLFDKKRNLAVHLNT